MLRKVKYSLGKLFSSSYTKESLDVACTRSFCINFEIGAYRRRKVAKLYSLMSFVQIRETAVSDCLSCASRMKYCAGDKIEKNEMGWACGAYGRGEGGV